MSNRMLLTLWGGLFIICAGLGFIPEPEGALGVLMGAVSFGFFVPPGVLIWKNPENRGLLSLIRNLSALSLGLTLVLLVGNFLSVGLPQWAGMVLYYMLAIVSAPMIASGHWALSMFFWACLLMASSKNRKRK